MDSTKLIIKNFYIKLCTDVYSRFGMLILIFVIARIYGAELFGKFALSMAVANMFYILSEYGANALLIRDMRTYPPCAHAYWERFVFFKILACLTALIAIFITGFAMSLPKDTMILLIFSTVWFLANSSIDTIYAYFTAFEKLQFAFWNTFIYRTILYIVAFIGIVSFHISLPLLFFIIALSAIVGLGMGLNSIRTHFEKFHVIVDFKFIKELFKQTWPLALSGIFTSVYLRIDTLLISSWKGDIDTGLYNTAFRIFESLIFIPSIFISIILPKFSLYIKNQHERLKQASIRGITFMGLLAFPISVLFMLKANWIIKSIYGSSYAEAAHVLLYIAPAIIFCFMWSVPYVLLVVENKQYVIASANFIGMIFNVACNIIFIPKYGFLASASIASITQAFVCLFLCLSARKWIFNRSNFVILIKLIFAGICMACIISFVKINNYVLSLLSFLIFYWISYCIKLIQYSDIKLLITKSQNSQI